MVGHLDEVHARETARAIRLDGQHRPVLRARGRLGRLRSWFERFRRDAGHTVLGNCRCGLPSCPNPAERLPKP